MDIKNRKLDSLKSIMTAYKAYIGTKKSGFESLLDDFYKSRRISQSDYNALKTALTDYAQNILSVLASSRKVRVWFEPKQDEKDILNFPFENLESLIEESKKEIPIF
jgi:hypothetical protein